MIRSQPQKLENSNPGFYMVEVDDDFILVEPTRCESTSPADSDFVFLELIEDADTLTTYEDFILTGSTKVIAAQSTDEDFKYLARTRDAGTQIIKEDFIDIGQPRNASTQITKEDSILIAPTQNYSTQTANGDSMTFQNSHEEGSRVTDEDLNHFEGFRDAEPQLIEKDFIPESTRDASLRPISENLALLEPNPKANTLKIIEEFILSLEHIRDAKTQSQEEDFYFSMQNESKENVSVSTMGSPAENIETMFQEGQEYDSGMVCSRYSNVFSSIEESRIICNAKISKNRRMPKGLQRADKFYSYGSESNVSIPRRIAKNNRFNQFSCPENDGRNEHAASTNNCKGEIRFDFEQKGVTENHLAFDNKGLPCLSHQLPNSLYGNPIKQIHYGLETHELKNIKQNIVLNTPISKNILAPRKILDFEASEDQYSVFPFVDISAFPSSSAFYDFYEEKVHPKTQQEPMSVVKKEHTNCWICKKEVTSHSTTKSFSKCWFCRYRNNSKNNSRPFAYIHKPETFSYQTCKKEFQLKSWHDNEPNCSSHEKKIECNAMLDDLPKIYENYYSSHCRICGEKIKTHMIEYKDRKVYKCCSCFYKSNHKKYLQMHLHFHTGLGLFMKFVNI